MSGRPHLQFLIWTRTKIGAGSLRSIHNVFSGEAEACLFDFFEAHSNPPEHWLRWVQEIRAAGFPVRFVAIGDRIEAIAPHAAIAHLLDTLADPSHRRRVAYLQLRRAEKKARING